MTKQLCYTGLGRAFSKSAQSGVDWSAGRPRILGGPSVAPAAPSTTVKGDTLWDTITGVPEIQRKDWVTSSHPFHLTGNNYLISPNQEMSENLELNKYIGAEARRLTNGLPPLIPEMVDRNKRLFSEVKNTKDPELRSRRVQDVHNAYNAPGGAVDAALESAQPVIDAAPVKSEPAATVKSAPTVTAKPVPTAPTKTEPVVTDKPSWFSKPENIALLKNWGIPIGLGAGAMGLYGLLSRKNKDESRVGRVAKLGLLGAGLGAGAYGLYNMYQRGLANMPAKKLSAARWESLDKSSKNYVTGFIKACRIKEVDPTTLLPAELVKSADAGDRPTRPIYTDLIMPEERQEVFETGIKLATALHGVKYAQIDVGPWLDRFGRAMLGVSVLTGVPLGIAGHLVSRAMKSDAIAQREQRAKIKYYRDVTRELEQGLTGNNPPATLNI